MLILLPPSETKRLGGRRRLFRPEALALPELAPQRERVIDALVALAADPERSARALHLGHTQHDEATRNARLRTGPVMPAADRHTGVLFDALNARELDAAARRWLGAHAMIHTAALGPVGAMDAIPTHRLSAGVSVPGLSSLRAVWADAVTAALAHAAPPFILDLRSEGYRALGPVPEAVPSAYVRVVADEPDGTTRALNHFNKHAKGLLVRRLADDRPRASTAAGLLRWATAAGIPLRPGRPGELELVA